MNSPVDPKPSKQKLEDYELDDHVRTLTKAHEITNDKNLMKQVHKHAKKKKAALNAVTKMMGKEPDADDESKEAKSIDDIRSRKKKIKGQMVGME